MNHACQQTLLILIVQILGVALVDDQPAHDAISRTFSQLGESVSPHAQ
jgi:hypothetical protein